jgi:hypothetical protein
MLEYRALTVEPEAAILVQLAEISAQFGEIPVIDINKETEIDISRAASMFVSLQDVEVTDLGDYVLLVGELNPFLNIDMGNGMYLNKLACGRRCPCAMLSLSDGRHAVAVEAETFKHH